MNDMFFPGIVAGLLLVLIVACLTEVTDGVVPKDFYRAEAACLPYDGLTKVTRPNYSGYDFRAMCVDGTVIDLEARE